MNAPATVAAPPPKQKASLTGPKVLLMGAAGTGKTYSLGTLADWGAKHGKEMFVLFTDNGAESLAGYYKDKGNEIPPSLHWHTQLTRPMGLRQLMKAANDVAKYNYEFLTKMQDNERDGANNAFWGILNSCFKPQCDHCGKSFDPVDTWGPEMIFALDGLTELSNAAMKMQIGTKPTASQPDYGVAQNNLMNFLRLCAQGSQYTFVLISHPRKVANEISGAITVQVNTVGQAICGDIPPMFSDVIYAVRQGSEFTWDTAAYGVETKTRSLGYRAKITPDFGQIMDLWLKRGGK